MMYPESQKRWDKENAMIFSVKFMRRTEDDLISYMDRMLAKGVGKGTLLKTALKEYMQNHPEEKEETNAVQNP